MFAIVESGSITSMPKGNKSFKLGDTQYPASVFTLWTESERNAIGLYTVEIDETNKKNEKWYVNTNITYAFGSGKVTGSYGTATAKAHADTLWTQEDEDAGLGTKGDVKDEGLKTKLIRGIKNEVKIILNRTDWYVTRKAEEDTAIPSAITTHRRAVRTKQASMETAITNAADTAALEALYTRDSDNDRPLGELPELQTL